MVNWMMDLWKFGFLDCYIGRSIFKWMERRILYFFAIL